SGLNCACSSRHSVFGDYHCRSSCYCRAEVGIGAILGAPMMFSTLAMFVTGAAVIVFSSMRVRKTTMLLIQIL
ncbi:MAG TPA: hypothetical protein PKV43_08660, partial [Armatimonadota bacterium]|nr:hypothetical protein [Armatimonadota bacterium]